jgi:hypothetical protein
MTKKLFMIGLFMTLAVISVACGKGPGRKSGLSNPKTLHSEEWEGVWLDNSEPFNSKNRASAEALVPSAYFMLAVVPRNQVPLGSLKSGAVTEIGPMDFELLESVFAQTYEGEVKPKSRRYSSSSTIKAFAYLDASEPNRVFILAERSSPISDWLLQNTPITVRSNPIQFCSQLMSPPAPGFFYINWPQHMHCMTKPITVNCNWAGRCAGHVIIPCTGRADSVHWIDEPLNFFVKIQPKSVCTQNKTDFTVTQTRQNERRAIAIRIRAPQGTSLIFKL